MDSWYSRESIASTQAASRLVLNLDNCVDKSRVIKEKPRRPPDSICRESFVYLMDATGVRNIRDLPIDDLAPWNSVLRRYIISDTENVPDNLLACYYCKHPNFQLSKKIFYACDGRRESCLDGTFIVFVYEFDAAEKLQKCTYANTTCRRSIKQQENDSPASADSINKVELSQSIPRPFSNNYFKSNYFSSVYDRGDPFKSLNSSTKPSLLNNSYNNTDSENNSSSFSQDTGYDNLLQFNNAVNFCYLNFVHNSVIWY